MYFPDNQSFTKQVRAHPWGDSPADQVLEDTPRIYSAPQTGFSSSGRAHRSPQSPAVLQQRAASWSVGKNTTAVKDLQAQGQVHSPLHGVSQAPLQDFRDGSLSVSMRVCWGRGRSLGRGREAGRLGRGRVTEHGESRGRQTRETFQMERAWCPVGEGNIQMVPKCLTWELGEQEHYPREWKQGKPWAISEEPEKTTRC